MFKGGPISLVRSSLTALFLCATLLRPTATAHYRGSGRRHGDGGGLDRSLPTFSDGKSAPTALNDAQGG